MNTFILPRPLNWCAATPRYAVPLMAAAGIWFATVPAPAMAYVKCDITSICSQTAMNEGQTTRNRIQQMESVLAQAIDTARRDIVTAIGQLTQAVTGSASKNAQTIGDQQAAMQQQQQVADVIRGIAPPQCGNAGASQGPASGGSRSAGRAGGVNYQPGRVDARGVKAMKAAEQAADPTPPPKEADEQKADLAVGFCKTFADPQSIRGMFCAFIDAAAQAMNRYKDADIKATTLMDGPIAQGGAVKNLSIPPEGDARDARNAYLTMLNNASPPSSPDEEALKSPRGKAYMGLYTEYRAAKSMAAYPSEEYDRMTTVDPSTTKQLALIQQSDAAFLNRYFSGMEATSYQNGVSPMMMMDIEVERRIGNEDWLIRAVQMDDKAKQAEQMYMQAYSMRMQRDLLVAQWQTNVLLGKMLNNSVEQTYRPQLDKLNADLRFAKTNALPSSATR